MARGVNKVILVATVGKDPEVKYMPSGGAVVNLTAATNESWKDKQTGEKKERTEWHRLTFYNRLAEIVGEYVRKGSQIYIEAVCAPATTRRKGRSTTSPRSWWTRCRCWAAAAALAHPWAAATATACATRRRAVPQPANLPAAAISRTTISRSDLTGMQALGTSLEDPR
jgi:hypothetical protein